MTAHAISGIRYVRRVYQQTSRLSMTAIKGLEFRWTLVLLSALVSERHQHLAQLSCSAPWHQAQPEHVSHIARSGHESVADQCDAIQPYLQMCHTRSVDQLDVTLSFFDGLAGEVFQKVSQPRCLTPLQRRFRLSHPSLTQLKRESSPTK